MSHIVRRLSGVTGTAAAVGALAVASLAGTTTGGVAWADKAPALHSSVVIARDGRVAQAAAAVRAAGGRVGRQLSIINGFTANVSSEASAALSRSADIVSVSPDAPLQAASSSYDPTVAGASYAATSRASSAWALGDSGAGVTVAVLDTGVAPVPDLAGRLIQGPDFSGEQNSLEDNYGHGTVMAGLIAGSGVASNGAYPGIAPAARIVSVKVAGRNGATDVSQVLAGLQWIGSFAAQDNIKVVSIAWGTDGTQSPVTDPLDFAVERLWGMGITVIASAGNSGPGPMTITKPGDDPAVVTVGAYDDLGTVDASDDAALSFSSRGPTANGDSKPDLVAPGRTLIATSSPNSTIVLDNPQALVAGGYIRGSGTSQATAVTAGAAALVLARNPSWTPDQVKFALTSTSHPISNVSPDIQGAGEIRISRAVTAAVTTAPTQALNGYGVGSLEGSRGDAHVSTICPGDTTPTTIQGEIDARCNAWDGEAWAGEAWAGEAWAGEAWAGEAWAGEAWAGEAWAGEAWAGEAWAGEAWADKSWDGAGSSG